MNTAKRSKNATLLAYFSKNNKGVANEVRFINILMNFYILNFNNKLLFSNII